MNRILPAALLAIGIHWVLLNTDTFRLHNVFTFNPKPKIVTLTLIYKTTPKPVLKSGFKTFNLRPLPPIPIKKLKPLPKIEKVPPIPIVKQVPLAVSKKFQKPGIPPKMVNVAPETLRQFRITHPSPKVFSASKASQPTTAERPIPPKPQPVLPEAVSAQPHPMAVRELPSAAAPSQATSADAPAAAAKPVPPPLIEARPLYKKNPTPRYPSIARRRGYEGTVILEVLVDPYGRVGNLNIYRSSGYSILDRAAKASVKNWQFEPGRKGNTTIAMWMRIPIRFQLK